jgi:hypothetical protein
MTPTPRRDSRRTRTASVPSEPARIAEFVRWPNIATARARVAAGWYDRADVKDRLVDALLEELRRR